MSILKAVEFATLAHAGQVRKYTGEPYIIHPIRVARLIGRYHDEVLTAAILHDTVEDTAVTLEEIYKEFGPVVGYYVEGLTDISTPGDGNRAERKAKDRSHIARGDSRVHTIKLADLIDNTKSIVVHDPKFAEVYLKEKKALLAVLHDGDTRLLDIAYGQLEALI